MPRVERIRLLASLLLLALVLAPSAAFAERMRCASVDYRRSFCRTDREPVRVRVERRYSKRPCVEGRTWGYNRRGIWVDNGCDADFEFRLRGDRDRDRDRYR